MLYYLENTKLTKCKTCRHSRYKLMTGRGRTLVSQKKNLDTLQSHIDCRILFISPKTTEHITWHQSHDTVDAVIIHPSNGETWKHFNNLHPQFLVDTKHMHLGL